jgi:sulfatase modifying factor 1
MGELRTSHPPMLMSADGGLHLCRMGHAALAIAALAMPVALAACPQFMSDWKVAGRADGSSPGDADDGHDGAPDATPADSGHGVDSGSSGMTDSASGADASLPPPSCAAGGAGMTTCPAGTGSESCCTSLEVTGGSYFRTYTSGADGGPVGEADPATVSGFRLDKYEVTVGRFRQFVNAVYPNRPDGGGGWLPTAASGRHTHLNGGQGLVNAGAPTDAGTVYEIGWMEADDSNIAPTTANLTTSCTPPTWTSTAGTNATESLPINCVNWWEAYAFCIWDGGFLPSEAEYEYAAAGGSQMLEYPWGSTAPGTACPGTGCSYAIYNCDYPSGSGSCTSVANIAPVGSAPMGAGYWGQQDIAGNMGVWVLDWYESAYATNCVNCADVHDTAASERVRRGVGFDEPAASLLPPYRNPMAPTYRGFGHGIRCARTP